MECHLAFPTKIIKLAQHLNSLMWSVHSKKKKKRIKEIFFKLIIPFEDSIKWANQHNTEKGVSKSSFIVSSVLEYLIKLELFSTRLKISLIKANSTLHGYGNNMMCCWSTDDYKVLAPNS